MLLVRGDLKIKGEQQKILDGRNFGTTIYDC